MKLKLKLEKLADAPRANGGKSRTPALGWSEGSTVHIVRGFDRWLFAFGRKVHECLHLILDADNDELHTGHTLHGCARSWHAVRPFPRLHATDEALRVAELLDRDGAEVEVRA